MKSIWLTYDLGVGGDYKNLYAWLDDHGAIDCGNNFAYLKMPYSGQDDESFMKSILSDIQRHVSLEPGNRIYVVRSLNDGAEKMTKGSFIYGKRMSNPWQGYGRKGNDVAEEG